VLAEGAHEVRAVGLPEDAPHVGELVGVEAGEVGEAGVVGLRALDLTVCEVHQPVEVAVVAAHEQVVLHHRQQGRRQRHGEAVVDAVLQQPVENADDRDVGLGQGLEEPVLLEELRVLGMADVGEVGVQYRAPIPGGHRRTSGRGPD
jgi:hypothetical protein